MRTCPHCRAACADGNLRCPGCGADVAQMPRPDEDRLVGRVLGRYRVEACAGVGSMSRVYRARLVEGGREVALKVLSAEDSSDPVLARRFELEARAIGRLRHDSNLTVLDVGKTDDGQLYLVTEMLSGRTLDTILREEAPLDPQRVTRLLAQALDALSEAHAAGIVHRDLKPDNLFIEITDGEEHVRVIDYGIAKLRNDLHDPKLTASGSVCGTPDYMAPEQIRGDDLDGRADVYAAGVVLYEMLTGSRPFSGSVLHVLTMHMHHPPEPPTLRRLDRKVPAGLERVCLRALAKERSSRYGSAAEMRAELLAALQRPSAAEAGGDSSRVIGLSLPLVGRERALAGLVETRRGATLLLGPGGSGRTRLLEEWRRRLLERGEQVIAMRPDPSTARVSWQPVRRALAAALGVPERPTLADLDAATRDRIADWVGLREVFGLGGPAAPEERAFRRREAMAASVGVLRDAGAALACEDVDRYDRPSVEVITALMLDPGMGRVVLTARSRGELPEGSTLEIGPLAPAEVAALGLDFTALGVDASQPQLPLAIEAAQRAAADKAADASPRARLDALLPTARRVLVAAVVGGLEVDTELLAQVTALADVQAPLATLCGRGLLRHEGGRAALLSPTLRDELYAALDAGERSALHRTYAGLLSASEADPALVAHHAWAADPDSASLEQLERAMVAAERAFDDPGAVRWGVRALKRARANGPSSHHRDARDAAGRSPTRLSPRVRTAVALGEALLRARNAAHAEPAFREALAAAGTEPLALALAHRGLAHIAIARGEPEVAEQEFTAAISKLPSPAADEDALITGELHLELATLRDSVGRTRDAETALIQGAVRVPGAPEISWRLLLGLAERLHADGRDGDARKLAKQALGAAVSATPIARARAHEMLAAIETGRGEVASAHSHRDAAVKWLRRAGDRLSIAELLLGSAMAAGPDEAAPRGWLAEAGELARQVGWSEGVARAQSALLQQG